MKVTLFLIAAVACFTQIVACRQTEFLFHLVHVII